MIPVAELVSQKKGEVLNVQITGMPIRSKKMSLTGMSMIRGCESVQELRELWEENVDQWSKLPEGQARAFIQAKDMQKRRLELFEELVSQNEVVHGESS